MIAHHAGVNRVVGEGALGLLDRTALELQDDALLLHVGEVARLVQEPLADLLPPGFHQVVEIHRLVHDEDEEVVGVLGTHDRLEALDAVAAVVEQLDARRRRREVVGTEVDTEEASAVRLLDVDLGDHAEHALQLGHRPSWGEVVPNWTLE
jgi:hypothetical protein